MSHLKAQAVACLYFTAAVICSQRHSILYGQEPVIDFDLAARGQEDTIAAGAMNISAGDILVIPDFFKLNTP